MPRAGNIAKTMTSNGKQFTVTREMLTAVARDQSVQLKVAWCCRRNLSAFFKITFFFLLYNKSLNDWSFGKQWILFPSNLNVSLDFVSGNIEILGKKNSLFPSGPVIKCLLLSTHRSLTNTELHALCVESRCNELIRTHTMNSTDRAAFHTWGAKDSNISLAGLVESNITGIGQDSNLRNIQRKRKWALANSNWEGIVAGIKNQSTLHCILRTFTANGWQTHRQVNWLTWATVG